MSKQSIRTKRERRLAELINEGLRTEREVLTLLEIFPRFTGEAAFKRLSNLHSFVNTQHVNAPHDGAGGERHRGIKLDSTAKNYVNDRINKPTHIDQVPDFTPVGDPIFTLTQAPRMHVND